MKATVIIYGSECRENLVSEKIISPFYWKYTGSSVFVIRFTLVMVVLTLPQSDSEIFDKHRHRSNLRVSLVTVGVKLLVQG